MNKKKIILLFILTLIGILCVFLNGKEEPEIENVKVPNFVGNYEENYKK